jgi:hypothetical protein
LAAAFSTMGAFGTADAQAEAQSVRGRSLSSVLCWASDPCG